MTRLDLGDGLRLIHETGAEDHFGHESHLRFGWALLDEADDTEDAGRVACLTIRHAAELAGNAEKFHYTITLFWVRMLAHIRETHPEVRSLEEALIAFPDLRDARLPDRYWSSLDGEEARANWVEPDLAPLP